MGRFLTVWAMAALTLAAAAALAVVAADRPARPAPAPAPGPSAADVDRALRERQEDAAQSRAALATLGQELAALRLEGAHLEAQAEAARRREAEALNALAAQDSPLAEVRAVLGRAERDLADLRERLGTAEAQTRRLERQLTDQAFRRLPFHGPTLERPPDREQFFECKRGRVSLIELSGLLELAARALPGRAAELRARGTVTDAVGPVGPFRLRYTAARQDPAPGAAGGIYLVTRWELLSDWPERGEPIAQALAEGSAFRRCLGVPAAAVGLTCFVYPDSFGPFRQLRDALTADGYRVTARPFRADQPITGTPAAGPAWDPP
jgi:hypothetical protein